MCNQPVTKRMRHGKSKKARLARLTASLVILVLVSFAANRSPSAQPSFDCARATLTVERAICASEDLSRLDRELGQQFSATVRLAQDPEALRAVQREWISRRNSCQTHECILASFSARIAQLREGAAAENAPRAPISIATGSHGQSAHSAAVEARLASLQAQGVTLQGSYRCSEEFQAELSLQIRGDGPLRELEGEFRFRTATGDAVHGVGSFRVSSPPIYAEEIGTNSFSTTLVPGQWIVEPGDFITVPIWLEVRANGVRFKPECENSAIRAMEYGSLSSPTWQSTVTRRENEKNRRSEIFSGWMGEGISHPADVIFYVRPRRNHIARRLDGGISVQGNRISLCGERWIRNYLNIEEDAMRADREVWGRFVLARLTDLAKADLAVQEVCRDYDVGYIGREQFLYSDDGIAADLERVVAAPGNRLVAVRESEFLSFKADEARLAQARRDADEERVRLLVQRRQANSAAVRRAVAQTGSPNAHSSPQLDAPPLYVANTGQAGPITCFTARSDRAAEQRRLAAIFLSTDAALRAQEPALVHGGNPARLPDLDAVYQAIQRGQCATVIGSAPEIGLLIDRLELLGRTPTALGVVLDGATLNRLVSDTERAIRQQRLADERAEREEEAEAMRRELAGLVSVSITCRTFNGRSLPVAQCLFGRNTTAPIGRIILSDSGRTTEMNALVVHQRYGPSTEFTVELGRPWGVVLQGGGSEQLVLRAVVTDARGRTFSEEVTGFSFATIIP